MCLGLNQTTIKQKYKLACMKLCGRENQTRKMPLYLSLDVPFELQLETNK